MMPGMNHSDCMMGWCVGGWGWLWILLPSVALIALVVWVLARSGRGGPSPPGRTEADPLRILEERFARGEIDKEEFENRRAALRNDDP